MLVECPDFANQKKRPSPKHFEDYNDYHDRGLMKWITAYAMDELAKGISENHQEAIKEVPPLPQMTQGEIEEVLQQAFFKHWPVYFQKNTKDQWGRYEEVLQGYFLGEATVEKVKIGTRWLLWEDVRHVGLLTPEKWFLKNEKTNENS